MKAYHYHPETGEFLGTSDVDESPLEPGNFLVPAHATLVAPPAPAAGMRLLFDGTAWQSMALPEPEPEPEPMPPATPEVVTMRQARLALLRAGLLDQANTMVASMPGVEGDEARIEWDFAGTVQRNNSLVLSLAAGLGLTNGQLDELFFTAASL